MRQEQVALVNALRDITGAPLDELLQMVNSGLGIAVSRATLNRYLKPASESRRARRCREKGAEGRHRAAKTPVASSALSLHMDDGGEQHLLWAREPVSGWCYARLYAGISPQLLAHWTNDALEPVRLIYNLLRLLVLR
jgi:hypothetical protein